jgi:ribosomal protein S18 acetylase RimI-like enzyme
VRKATLADLDRLVELEHHVFTTDHLSRRSLRRFLDARTAELLVAEEPDGTLAGTAIVLFRQASDVARLYSIAVAPHMGGRGLGPTLLDAAEAAALARECRLIRLEVHATNAKAISLYRKRGYREFGRHARYYEDGGDALRFEKRLTPDLAGLRAAPRYVHQTTDFTCGPACVMMALAWADPRREAPPALELQLWREATTIFMASGPGGCDAFGLAVALKRHGLEPEIYVSDAGPHFLDAVRSPEKRRVMELTQAQYRREAKALGIPRRQTPAGESVFMQAFEAGKVALVLVSGYHMVRRGQPHWVFAFGREGRHILLHDPAAFRDDDGRAIAPETYAVPWTRFEPMLSLGPNRLSATILVRKGPPR